MDEKSSPTSGLRFWIVMSTLCVMTLLASLENTVVVTSLPSIIASLHIGNEYVWITTAFFLANAAFQPLFGQLADLFGRHILATAVVSIFTIGSAICGSANNGAALIAGRIVQGTGSGGISTMISIIVSDLIPLRQRSQYMALVIAVYGLGLACGPFVGGLIVEHTTWRWVFFLNVPIGVLGAVLLFFFCKMQHYRTMTVLIGAMVSLLLALTNAGAVYAWSSWHVLVPLCMGFLGLVMFLWLQDRSRTATPLMPLRLFRDRTAAISCINTFIYATMSFWILFFIPLYLQGVQLWTPFDAGVRMLPYALVVMPAGVVAALILTRTGRYKLVHLFGFSVWTLGLGLLGVLDERSKMAVWVALFIVVAIGSGTMSDTLLPAFQATLHDEADQAAATSTWCFIRAVGNIWGFAIATSVFTSYIKKRLPLIDNADARHALSGGRAYSSVTKDFVESFSLPIQAQLRALFADALQKVWWVGMAFTTFALVITVFERQLTLVDVLQTEFGLESKETAKRTRQASEDSTSTEKSKASSLADV